MMMHKDIRRGLMVWTLITHGVFILFWSLTTILLMRFRSNIPPLTFVLLIILSVIGFTISIFLSDIHSLLIIINYNLNNQEVK